MSAKHISKRITNISLAYSWGSANVGDKAITPGVVKAIKRAFPQCTLTVVSLLSPRNPDYADSLEYLKTRFPDIRCVPQPLQFIDPGRHRLANRLNRFTGLLSLISPSLASKIFPGNVSLAALIRSDLIIGNGGVLFFWTRENARPLSVLFTLMYPFLLARRLRIPYGFYGQTIGPFRGVGRRFFRWFFSSASFIFTRESVSRQHINALGITAPHLRVVPDGAFALEFTRDDRILDTYSLRKNNFAVVTLRETTFGYIGKLGPSKAREYFTFMRQYLEDVHAATGLTIVVVAQTRKDHAISKAMADELGASAVLIADLDTPEDLINLYSYSSFVVGMRLHSVIFALVSGVPAIAVYYKSVSHKTAGIMGDLGLSASSFDIDTTAPDDLLRYTLSLWNDREAAVRRIRHIMAGLDHGGLESVV